MMTAAERSPTGAHAIKHLCRFFVAAALFLGLFAGFNFVIDPLQIFHRPWITPARYSSDPRFGNAGLIRSQEFDTAFMGTSYSVQLRQSEIDQRLGGKSLKLAISGGTSKEQNVVLTAALTRHPKRIVWQMDDYMFRNSGDVDAYMPADLYQMNLKGLAEYLLNLRTARESLWMVLRSLKPLQRVAHVMLITGYLTFNETDVMELNTFPSNIDPASVFNSARAKAAFEQQVKSPHLLSAGIDYASMVVNFDRDALKLIKDNPDTQFTIFPPSSILHWAAMRDASPQTLADIYKLSQHELTQLTRLPNATVHDFRAVEQITHDLDNYTDTIHYSPQVNRRILSFIAAGEHQVDRINPTASIGSLRGQVERYNVITLR